MGNNTDEMSETYRRIRKKRARARRKRQRRIKLIKMCVSAGLVVLVAGSLVFKIAGKNNAEHIYGADDAAVDVTSDISQTDLLTSYISEPETETEEETQAQPVIEYPKVPSYYTSIPASEVNAPYQALYSVDDNELIAGRQAMENIYPASMTKVMTLIVAVEHIDDFNKTFEMTAEIIDPLVDQQASRAGFDPGENVSAEDLLYGLALPSGADCAVALAQMTAGSEEQFVVWMNEKCSELGLKNTHFMNTSGLYNSRQYTTPLEIAMIMSYAMKNEKCAEVLSTYQHTTQSTAQHPEGILLTSTMFSRMYGNEVENVLIKAGKTGYTDEAGNCLVSYAVKDGKAYIGVSAGAANRWHVIYDAFTLYGNYIK